MPDEPIIMAAPGIDQETGSVRFDLIKANTFKVIHVDGIFGGPSPGLDYIHMAVWNERWPIPKQTVHELSEDGSVRNELIEERICRDAIVREVEAQLVFNIKTAKKMLKWLDEKIEQYEQAKNKQENEVEK